MYCLFEHSYYVRESDAQRTVFRFNPLVAPIQATVLPLLNKPEMIANAERVSDLLEDAGISNLIDTTGGQLNTSRECLPYNSAHVRFVWQKSASSSTSQRIALNVDTVCTACRGCITSIP